MITLIFGAGASYGSGRCNPNNPPLGNHLLNDLVNLDGAFSRLDKTTQKVFIDEGFEAGMAEVPDDNRIINPIQKELACYLSSFSITDENAYVRLFNKLKSNINDINIVTLNYDLLIEQALWSRGYQVDYNGEGKGVNVLKPHGSSNFLPQLNGLQMSGNTMIGVGSFIEGLKTEAVQTHNEIKDWCNNPMHGDVSPVLSMYNKDKRIVVNQRLIKNIQNKYADFVDSSNLIVLVGIKYIPHDEHIWGSLTRSNAPILIVDPYPEDTIKWAETNSKDQVSILQKGFDASVWDITKVVRSHLQNGV